MYGVGEEAEAHIGVATEGLERAAEEAKRREVKEDLRRAEEGGRGGSEEGGGGRAVVGTAACGRTADLGPREDGG